MLTPISNPPTALLRSYGPPWTLRQRRLLQGPNPRSMSRKSSRVGQGCWCYTTSVQPITGHYRPLYTFIHHSTGLYTTIHHYTPLYHINHYPYIWLIHHSIWVTGKKKSAEHPRLQEHLHSPGLREGGLADFSTATHGKVTGRFSRCF